MVMMAISRPSQYWWRIQKRISLLALEERLQLHTARRKVLPTNTTLSRRTMSRRWRRKPDSPVLKWKPFHMLVLANLEALAVGQSLKNYLLVATLEPGEGSLNLPKNMYALMMTIISRIVIKIISFSWFWGYTNAIAERLPSRWKRWRDCENEPW